MKKHYRSTARYREYCRVVSTKHELKDAVDAQEKKILVEGKLAKKLRPLANNQGLSNKDRTKLIRSMVAGVGVAGIGAAAIALTPITGGTAAAVAPIILRKCAVPVVAKVGATAAGGIIGGTIIGGATEGALIGGLSEEAIVHIIQIVAVVGVLALAILRNYNASVGPDGLTLTRCNSEK